jgi:hypothetical protein
LKITKNRFGYGVQPRYLLTIRFFGNPLVDLFSKIQYFLAALGIVLCEEKQPTLLSIVEGCLQNAKPDTMRQPEIEVFKVWPTFRDRSNFQFAMRATSLDELRQRFPRSSSHLKNGALEDRHLALLTCFLACFVGISH